MQKPTSVSALDELGRVQLPKSFIPREFLHSEVANFHRIPNIPDAPELAIAAGRQLCEGWCQTNSNSSQQGQNGCPLCRAELTPLGESGGTVLLEICPRVEIEEGWFQKHIADFAYDTALRKQSGEKPVIGVNRYRMEGPEESVETHPYDPTTADRQISRLHRVRAERDEAKVQGLLKDLAEVAKDDRKNILPLTIELVREGASMGDIVETLKEVWGTYRETPVF